MRNLVKLLNHFSSEEFLSRKVRILTNHDIELGTFLAVLMVLIYASLFSYVTILRYYSFRTTGWDLGIAMQILWNTMHGRPFYYTYELSTVPSGNFLALHFAPIFIFLVPLYALAPRAETLLILQSLVLGLGAIPLYLLAKRVLGSRVAALLIATTYLLYPPLHGVNWFDFHVEAFIPFLIISLYYFIETRKIPLIYLFTILSLMTITFTPVIIATIMICGLIETRRDTKLRKHILILLVTSIAYFYLAIKISNALAGTQYTRSFELQMWDRWGSYLGEIIINVLTHPLDAIMYMATPWDKILYPIVLLAPMLFLPVFAPLKFIPALAWIIPAMLSKSPPFGTYLGIYDQYPSFVIGQLFVATIYTLKKLADNKRLVATFAKRLVLVTLILSVFMSPLGVTGLVASQTGNSFLSYPVITQHDKYLSNIISLIPSNASVLAQNDILPHVSNRMYVFGTDLPDDVVPDYILVDVTSTWAKTPITTAPGSAMIDLVNDLLSAHNYGLLASADGILLYKLNYTGSPLLYAPFTAKYGCNDFAVVGGRLISIKEGRETEEVLMHEPTDEQDTFFYGPYVLIPPGTYEVTYTLKVEGNVKPEQHVIDLDVAADKGQTEFAERPIYGLDIPATGSWFNVTIKFALDKFYSDVEFRGLNVGNFTVYLKSVVVKQLSYKPEPVIDSRFDYRRLAISEGEVVNGIIMHRPGDGAGTFWYGPYIELLPGNYCVTFWLKLDNTSTEHVLDLDVAYNKGTIILNRTSLYAKDFVLGVWKPYTLMFTLNNNTTDVEFRGVNVENGTQLSLLFIEVKRLDSSGECR